MLNTALEHCRRFVSMHGIKQAVLAVQRLNVCVSSRMRRGGLFFFSEVSRYALSGVQFRSRIARCMLRLWMRMRCTFSSYASRVVWPPAINRSPLQLRLSYSGEGEGWHPIGCFMKILARLTEGCFNLVWSADDQPFSRQYYRNQVLAK